MDSKLIRDHYRAQTDFWFFCTEVLGYKKSEISGYYDLTGTHYELCRLLEQEGNKIILMPRHSIKSHLITVGHNLWDLAKDPNLRILIYSDSATKAQGFLYGMKTHIEGRAPGSKFREFYPNWENNSKTGDSYNESRIVVKARTHGQKEPSVDTGGIESSKIGMHYDKIVFDDIVSDMNVTTRAQMDKIHDCYKKSLSLLKPGGEIIIVGTRWHFGDAYGRIIDDNKERENFKVFIRSAEDTGEDGKLLFDGIGLDRGFLDYQKREQGSYIYSCLYCNNPVDEDIALFKEKDFKYYMPHPTFHKNLFITGTCDPAGEGADYTAITVVGTDSNRRMYVLDAINAHLKPNQIIDKIISLNYKWGFHKFSIERNFFRGTLERDFKIAQEEHRKNEKYKAITVTEDIVASRVQQTKNRIMALQPFHERRDLYFPCNSKNYSLNTLEPTYRELAFQMLQYTIDGSKSPRDDLLTSLSMHVDILNRGGGPKPMGLPRNCPAELEERWVKEHNRVQRLLPRRMRKIYQKQLS